MRAADTAALIPDGYRALLAGRTAEGFDDGPSWLRRLPGTLTALCEQWRLTVDGPSWYGYCAIAVPVQSPRGPAVLKINWPHPEAANEHLALKRWDGNGAIRLLAADPARWALLLERAHADRDLYAKPLQQACAVIGELLNRLAVPALPQLVRLSDEAVRISETIVGFDAIPRRFTEQARSLCAELVADPGADARLVHSDLHYGNVLASDREPWLAIDPKPMAAEPAFGVAPALWNRWDEVTAARSPRDHLGMRLRWLCEAGGIDEDRAKAWTIVREVQNARWAVGSGSKADDRAAGADRLTTAVTVIKAMQ